MTRVAGVPEQLRAAATVLTETAPELNVVAAALSAAPLPELPDGVAAQVQSALHDASSALRNAAVSALREGQDLKRRGLWLELADAGTSAWAFAVVLKASVDIPTTLMDFVERKRALDLLRTWSRYERTVLPIVRDYGENSMEATKIWLLFQRSHPEFATKMMTVADGAGELSEYERAAGVPLPLIRGAAGKILGPLGIVASGWLILHPEHDHGWQRTGDRIAGGAGVIGSGLATASAVGALEAAGLAIPGVNVAIAALLIGSAAWDLYTHRKEVAHALVAGGKFLVDHHVLAAVVPGGAAAQAVYDHRRDIARGAVAVAEFGVHRAEDVAHTVTSIGSVGSSVVGDGKKLIGGIFG